MASPARELPPHAAPLAEAASRGVLLLQRCRACGETTGFPRIACPRCFEPLEWFEAAGTGEVVACTVIRRPHQERFAEHLPIMMATIRLAEGPQVISTVVGEDRLETRVGAAVAVTAEGTWAPLPQFRLLARGGGRSD